MATESSAAFALSARTGLPPQPLDPAPRWLLPLVVAAHAALLVFLATLDVIPLPSPLATLMVQVIAPAPPPAAEITPPRPATVERKPKLRPQPTPSQPQMLAVPAEAPSAAVEVPIVKEAPTPAPALQASTVSQPRFDADYLHNPPPAYPALSRRMSEEGKVVLRVFVEPGGRPGQIEIRTSSGSQRLDQAALEAVWRWKFIPARRGEEAVGAWVLVPIVFNLRG